MNRAISEQLSKYYTLEYVGPVNPKPDYFSKLLSKLLRVTGRPGPFHTFSRRRLRNAAVEIDGRINPNAAFDFFHGATPWIMCRPLRPYFTYLDCCFGTYIDIYHERGRFLESDLQRIEKTERKWLAQAKAVFFSSKYALDETARRYDFSGHHLHLAGLGASIQTPDTDSYQGQPNLLFVANDFYRKGGMLCVKALAIVREVVPGANLIIIGQRPPTWALQQPGVLWRGFLRKTSPEELKELQACFASAFVLLLPTTSDMTPLVIPELGFYGCPVIASRSFGIPEMVKDGTTGLLLKPPPSIGELATKVIQLFQNASLYRFIRKEVRAWSIEEFCWPRIVNKMRLTMDCMVSAAGS